jgi:hypothetical protein
MAIEPLITKLNQNLNTAKELLRTQLLKKVKQLSEHIENAELRDELERLVDDVLSQFTTIYEGFISYIEEELPDITLKPKPPKPRKKAAKKEQPEKPEFVRPTYVHRAFTEDGLRVSKEARPMLMDILNETIKEDIDRIKKQIPTFQKGEKEGEKKRITIKPEDISKEKLVSKENPTFERELDIIPLEDIDPNYKLLILLRLMDSENKTEF